MIGNIKYILNVPLVKTGTNETNNLIATVYDRDEDIENHLQRLIKIYHFLWT